MRKETKINKREDEEEKAQTPSLTRGRITSRVVRRIARSLARYPEAKDAVDLVPPRDLVGKKYASCAIVGNSGMLVYGKNGAEIDSHKMVMRFNGAPTKGLEDRVGSKTTFRLVNSKWTEFREFKEEMVLWNMRGSGAFEDFQLRRKNYGKSEQFHILSADFVNYVGEMVGTRVSIVSSFLCLFLSLPSS